jgi:hypothetical protein
MSNSSAPTTYLPISNDGAVSGNVGFIAQDIGPFLTDTVTLSSDTGSSYYYSTGAGIGGGLGAITISGGGTGGYTIATGSTVTIDSINSTSFNWKLPEEFVDAFPDYNRIEKMCKEYPGLAIAFEKFKTVYNLVKDHYDTPEDQRPKP